MKPAITEELGARKAMSDWVGRTLGRYEILAEIRQDDLGGLYQARDMMSGRIVSIRILPRSLTEDDPSLRQRLAREVERQSRLSHPHIARVYALEEIERHLCLVSDYVAGRTLRERLREEGSLRPEEARRIVSDIAAALDEAHQQGILHGDVRPSNIIIAEGGQAMLTDLGLAHIVQPPRPRRDRALGGAPAYMAPEIVRGEKPGPSTDLYALGIVLYEMLTGRPPFQGEDTEVMLAQVNEAPVPPSQVNPRLPTTLDAVFSRALAKVPSDRYRTAAQMAGDLAMVRAGARPFPVPMRTFLLMGVVLALVVAGGLAFRSILSRSRERPASPPVSLPAGSGLFGIYEVTAPQRMAPGETATVRLAIHIPTGLSPQDLPAAPLSPLQMVTENTIWGSVTLCRYIWGRLQATGLEVLGPSDVRRSIQPQGAEWLWDIQCPLGVRTPSKRSISIEMFVRQANADGTYRDIPLKNLHFDVEVVTGRAKAPSAMVIAGVVAACALGLLAIRALRARSKRARNRAF